MIRTLFTLCFFGTLLTATSAVANQGECHPYVPVESQNDPDLLGMRGVTCFESGEYLQALIFYRQAYSVQPSPFLQAGIGRCLQELGYPDLARQYFQLYLGTQSKTSEAYQRIQQRMDVVDEALNSKGQTVTLRTDPANAKVFLILKDEYWEEVGTTPMSLKLLPGEYRVVLQRPDFQTREVSFTIDPATPPPDSYALTPQLQVGSAPQEVSRGGVYMMIASTPFFALGTGMFVLAEFSESDADVYPVGNPNYDAERQRELYDGASRYRKVGIASAGIGATLFFSGLIWHLVQDSPSATSETTSRWSPVIAPDHVGLNLRW